MTDLEAVAVLALCADMATSRWLVKREWNPVLRWLASQVKDYQWAPWAKCAWVAYWLVWILAVLFWPGPWGTWIDCACAVLPATAAIWNLGWWVKRRGKPAD